MSVRGYVVTDPSTLAELNERIVASLAPPTDFVVTAKLVKVDELSIRRGDESKPRNFSFRMLEMTNVDSPYWYVGVLNSETGQVSMFLYDTETGQITFEEEVN